jgi:hypothetical protein
MRTREVAKMVTVVGGAKAAPWYLETGIGIAYQPKRAASLAASYVNLAHPGTNNAIPSAVAPTWTANDGWILNGVSQYLNTGVIPSSNWTMIIRFSDAAPSSLAGMGNSDSGFTYAISLDDTEGVIGYMSGGILAAGSATPTSGVIGLSGLQGYLDGVPDGLPVVVAPWTELLAPIVIGGQSSVTLGVVEINATIAVHIQAVAIYNITLTGAQMLAVMTAMAAL